VAGQLDASLQHALQAGQRAMAAAGEGLLGRGQTAYCTFGPGLRGPPRFDREMRDVFDFSALEASLSGVDGTIRAEHQLAQYEYAVLARMARDQRMRRRTRLEQHAHGLARLKAYGHERGLFTGPLLERLKLMLDLGDPPK
jgi:hypothetical protein